MLDNTDPLLATDIKHCPDSLQACELHQTLVSRHPAPSQGSVLPIVSTTNGTPNTPGLQTGDWCILP